jgi:hypothetical protein
MVELPSFSRRLVTTEAPTSRVTAADVAVPGRMLANVLAQTAEGVNELTRAVENRKLSESALRIEEDMHRARLENAGHPEKFKAWAKGYAGELQKREPNPFTRAKIAGQLGIATTRTYNALQSELHAATFKAAKDSMLTRASAIDDRMAAMAHEGETGSPEYAALSAEMRSIYDELGRQPLYGVSEEIASRAMANSEGRHIAEAVVHASSRGGLPPGPERASVVERIVLAESAGDPQAASETSTAAGAGQFLESTWLDLLARHRPDLTEGRSREEILEMRGDGPLSRQMVEALAGENADILERAGHVATARNLYLAHFLGAGGALAMLTAAPADGIREALTAGGVPEAKADAMIAANKTVLKGKTVGEIAQWASARMGVTDDTATLIEEALWDPDLPLGPEERRRYIGYAMAETAKIDAQRRKASGEAAEEHERRIIDASAGLGPLFPRSDIENDAALLETQRNAALRQYDAATKDVLALRRAYERFTSPQGGDFNPYDADDRKDLDRVYEALGGDASALKALVDQTGVAPPSVVKKVRGDLATTDPARIEGAMQLAANLMFANPHAFAGHPGASEIEQAALTFRHMVDDLGYTAEESAARLAEANTPEYKSRVAAQVKGEDIDKIVKDKLALSHLESAFDPAPWWPGQPTIGQDPETRRAMFSDYTELFRERYMESGDAASAKTLAAAQLKRVWGVTSVNGADIVSRYPPESAPGLFGLENPSEAIAAAALSDIEAETGMAAKREDLRLLPIPSLTADAWKTGRPVPYLLFWRDADDIVHTLDAGRAFTADPAVLRSEQTRLRAEAFRAAQNAPRPADPGLFETGADQILEGPQPQ